jgi:superfamily II DNA helicase RecQ
VKYRFFAIPALNPDAEQNALNTYCAGRRVVTVEKHFVADGSSSYWAICVTSQDGAEAPKLAVEIRRDRIDYRQVLSEPDFAVFANLRTLRKTLSDREGVPAYALFTNEQLAELVKRRVTSVGDMACIDGIGKSRVEKYGEAFAEVLRHSFSPEN